VPSAPPTRASRRVSRRVQLARRRVLALLILVVLIGTVIGIALTVGGAGADADTAPPADRSSTGATPTASSPSPSASPSPASPAPAETPSARVCEDPDVVAALAGGADDAVVDAVGGGEAFRAAVVGGEAPCLDLSEAGRMWVVVNKRRPLDPIDYWPTPQDQPDDIRVVSGGGWLRADVAAALDRLATAIVDDAGRIAVDSAFRPYSYQVGLYNRYVASKGRAAADLRSARPGHSEHQTGLAVDVVACDSGCGSHDGFKGTAQAQWLVDNAWRYGFVIRYEDGQTDVTGYAWEPWHLRYVGVELATAYHEGGFGTLEGFFGLPAAPDYAE